MEFTDDGYYWYCDVSHDIVGDDLVDLLAASHN